MVHCVKCGKDNPDDSEYCNKCGAQMTTIGKSTPHKRIEDECFGIPRGTSIFWLLIGVGIILWGISEIYGIKIEFWPMIIVIFGLLVVVGAFYRLTRRS